MRASRTLLIVIAVLLASAAPAAAAGSYQVYSCRTPAGVLAPTDGWSPIAGHGTGAENACATPGSGGIGATTLDQRYLLGEYEGWHYSVPPNLSLGKVSLWRYAQVRHHPEDEARATWAAWLSLGSPEYGVAKETCGLPCNGVGIAEDRVLLASNRLDFEPAGSVRDLYTAAGCISTLAGGTGCNVVHYSDGTKDGSAKYHVQALQAELKDSYVPLAQDVGGTLTDDKPLKGDATLDFVGTDRGSGLYRVWIDVKRGTGEWTTVDRRVVDANEGRCQELDYLGDSEYEFGFQVPCKLSSPVHTGFDTTTLTDGFYRVRAFVEDAAGNAAPALAEREITVDNVPPPSATTPPSIAGVLALGNTLDGVPGSWSGVGNSYAYKWARCTSDAPETCAVIVAGDGPLHRVVVDDLGRFLRLIVTASNAEGSTTATSAIVGPVTDADGAIPQCADGIDNDNDGKIDTDDAGCRSRAGTTEVETPTLPQDGGGHATPTPTPTATGTPGPSAGDGVANGVHASRNAQLSLSGPSRLKLGFRRSGTILLTLRDESGRAITGASVQVLQRMAIPGAGFAPAHAPVITDGDGRVRYTIDPGFGRTIRFAYAPTLGGTASVVRDLTVVVPSRTTLRTNKRFLHNGQTVRFLGRVASLPVPSGGVVIDLQARVGSHWQTFNSLRTDGSGRWHASYRFHATTGLQTYTFRARVRGDTGFPYTPSVSRRVKVRVKG